MTPSEVGTFLVDGRLERLQELLGPNCLVDPKALDEKGWLEMLRECNPEIIVSGWKTPPLPDDVREEVAPALKYLCYLPGSVKGIVSRRLIEKGLIVTNWQSSISRTVAECALLLCLCCMRRVAYWTDQMHNHGSWKTDCTVTQSLFERRIGIHGFGAIARALVPMLRPFTSKLSAYTVGVPKADFDALGVRQCDSIDELFSQNDVIVELEGLTPERVGMIDERLLRLIPQGGAFVNVARGALVDEEALVRIAREGKIQVGLDVYTDEPLPANSPFRGLYNINLLPHLGGPTVDRRPDATDHGLINLGRYRAGQPVLHPITLEIFDRTT